MKIQKLLVLALSTTLLLSACSKTQEEGTPAPAGDEAAVVEEIANAPEGCPTKNTLVVKSEEAGTVAFVPSNSWFLSWGPESGTFYFMNYNDFDPKNYSAHTIAGKDVRVSFDLKNKDKSPLKAGVWNYRKDAENNKLDWLNVYTEKLAGAVFDDNAKVEITYFGSDYVCGKVTATDSSSSLNGEFIAKFYDWKF
ncbi:hypothetical protein M0P48_01170 [Candidatus Gracilibacteria bacterium]|jgi:hypothetical protein|nr:hypothetical protein [Candidatus Gracilibacteria bacterium]